ncbi:MAG: DegT/DnrJ/EryC1/StrS family aminotransferase [Marmoricola sp.]|jgi:dTDP-4-amino-4,6-dideoxygalactose transaminase|nr:DegT/DnrJ/EryC1/StrS family aminotransferase [Marmoricola sp.]
MTISNRAGSASQVPHQRRGWLDVEGSGGTGTSMPVPFADCFISPAARDAASRVLASGWVTTGAEVEAFEREFADHVGARHAVAVTSCTVGIELALRALRLPDHAPVLTSTNTFCGAVHAILHAGLQPVLVDVDPVTGMPTPQTTAEANSMLQRRGQPAAAAMVVVHWAGDPADVPLLAQAAGLPLERVVEDAAHAVGTFTPEGPVGGGAAAACFSFYATKNLPIGEGGMITTNDAELARHCHQSRLHGMSKDAWRRYQPGGSWRYDVVEPGLKANMSDVQAAIGRGQLANIRPWQRRRAEIADLYDRGLAGLPGIALPHRPPRGLGVHAWHLYAIRVQEDSGTDRDSLAAALAARSIGTSVHFIPLHHFTAGRSGAYGEPRPLPGADRFADEVLSLPLHAQLSDVHVATVIEAVHAATSAADPATAGRNI